MVLVIEESDGSKVKMRTTLNRDILAESGIENIERGELYDLDDCQIITSLLDRVSYIEDIDMKVYGSRLDEFLEVGGKIHYVD